MSVGPIAPPSAGPGVSGVGAPVQGASSGGGQAPSIPLPTTAPTTVAPTGPLAALTATISDALATQDSLAPLLADLNAALQSSALPPAARATVEQILALQTPLAADVTGAALKAAIGQSGLFLEAGLAGAVLKSAGAPEASAATQDLKSLLLRLPADLSSESLAAAEVAAPAALGLSQIAARRAGPRPPPPIGGGRTTGQAAVPAVVDAETDSATLHHVLGQEAHAALARLELMQLASLPKAGEPSRWAFELPVATSQGASMAQFEISRDGAGGGAVSGDGEQSWKARFSIHLDPAGPVHAEVALSHGRTRVTLWAERDNLRRDLEQDQAGLVGALAGEEGGDAAVRVLSGAPAGPVAAASGQLVNRTS